MKSTMATMMTALTTIQPGESVSAHYSMAIRKDSIPGIILQFYHYLPFKPEGIFTQKKIHSFVHVISKDKEDDLRDFDANDRTKARVVVDSYRTEPAGCTQEKSLT